VDTHAVSVVVAHTLFTKSSVSAVSASARWHTVVNFLASQKHPGNSEAKVINRFYPTTNYVKGPDRYPETGSRKAKGHE
jgi:hypothetical protein